MPIYLDWLLSEISFDETTFVHLPGLVNLTNFKLRGKYFTFTGT